MESKMVGATKESRRGKQLQMHNNESAGDQMLSGLEKKEKRKLQEKITRHDARKSIQMQSRAHLVDRSSHIRLHVFPQTSN